MNFGDSYKNSKEEGFLARLLGIAILSQAAANFCSASTDAAYWNCLIATALVTYFGPIKAEQTFECTVMHKMPVFLMPALLAMAALAYF